jgi:hypothetical protein
MLRGVDANEVLGVLKRGLVGAAACISEPDVTGDEEDREGTEEGMRLLLGRVSSLWAS